jgi:Sec-independent protein secretion pathway component TatC
LLRFRWRFTAALVLASPFIFYFIASFVFPALKLRERKYIYRGLVVHRRRTVSWSAWRFVILS